MGELLTYVKTQGLVRGRTSYDNTCGKGYQQGGQLGQKTITNGKGCIGFDGCTEGLVSQHHSKDKAHYQVYHSDEDTQKAQDEFVNVVQNKGLPEDIPSFELTEDKNILDLLVELGFVASKGEAKRLIAGGGVKLDNEKVSDTALTIKKTESEMILQAGKRKYMRLV